MERKDTSFRTGILVSFLGHLIIAVGAFLLFANRLSNAAELTPVYTVTLEGGTKLGGVSQVPKDSKKKELLTPPTSEPVETEKETAKAKQKAERAKVEAQKKLDQDLIRLEKEKAAKKKREEAKRRQAEKEKKRKAEEKKRKEAEAKKKAEQERLAKLKKKKQEAERRKKEAAKKKLLDKKNREARFADTLRKARQKAYQGESANAGGEGFGAASLGGQGTGGGTLASAEFIAYMNALENHIKSGWRWGLSSRRSLIAKVSMQISRNGDILRAKIVKASGNSQFDDSVIRAVRKSSPVPRAPARLYSKFREVSITFDSNSG